jgi:SAM-dependent methyltransferase
MLSLTSDLAQVPRLVESFRTGVGIPYADYGPDQAQGRAMGTRPIYRTEIKTWFAAVPDLESRLVDGTARVLDIGCGVGWSSVSIAQAYPHVTVDGVDLDPGSIAAAHQVAEAEGVTDRVTFEVRDVATLSGAGYDVATMFEMLHDLARPWKFSASPARHWPRAESSWSPTNRSRTPTPVRPMMRSGATTAGACCTACRPA